MNNKVRILILCLLLSGCVYSPKYYDIEQLIECPIEVGGIS
jgi:starvation-inducible outer membrane lipoprotein